MCMDLESRRHSSHHSANRGNREAAQKIRTAQHVMAVLRGKNSFNDPGLGAARRDAKAIFLRFPVGVTN